MMHHLISHLTIKTDGLGAKESKMSKSVDPAELVSEIRIRLGLTQEKLAAKLGVTLPTINRWENGRARPSPLAVQGLRTLLSEMGSEGEDLMDRFFPENQ